MERNDIKDICKSGSGEYRALPLDERLKAMLGQNAGFNFWRSWEAATHMTKVLMGHLGACVGKRLRKFCSFYLNIFIDHLPRHNSVALTQSGIYNKK